jgi:tetratricopeptide (TPR) repeat protein
VAKHSVTELEIIHGVLKDPDMARRAFFYFRDPRYAQARGGDYESENAADAERQAALKARVKSVCQAKNIPLREDYADPRTLAALVLADLTAAIDAEFPADQVPDVWTREDRDHEAYAKSRRTEFYVGRDAYFERLDVYARDGAEGCGLVVLGESGGGKSALLANWVARWCKANPNDFMFQHYIGSSPMSASHLALMRRLIVSIIRWCSDDPAPSGLGSEEERIPAQAEEIVKAFPDYVSRLAAEAKRKGIRAIVVLDALNQLEDRERGRLLAWLPYRLPGELRLVVSTLPGDTTEKDDCRDVLDALRPRGWLTLTVEPLTSEERIRMIARYLTHFAQGLSDARAGMIAGKAAAANPLYIKTLLDDLRVTGAYDRLDAQIADYLQATDIPTLLGKVLTRYEHDYERDRPGLVREALSLLWAARRGLTEPELLEVLKPAGQERLPAALWSPVRYALEDGLVDRDGVLAFAHEHLRKAVEQRYVPNADAAKALRLQLADDFAAKPVDVRQADELPWLLRQADSRDRLCGCLLDIDRFLLTRERDEDELRGYWVWLGEERTMGSAYQKSFESWVGQPKRDDLSIADAANTLACFLQNAALNAEAEPLYRHALSIWEQGLGKNHPNVATSLSNLALLLQTTNRLAEAERLLRRALTIMERDLGKNHPYVAAALSNLAQLLQTTNRPAEAESVCRRALGVYEQSLGKNHAYVATALNNLAELLRTTNRLAEAEAPYRRALAIDEQSLGANHPNVARDLNNLGLLLQATNRVAEAEPLHRRALAIDERCFGASHPKVANRLNNLALVLKAANRLAEAEPLYRRAIAVVEQSLGENHPNVAIPLNNLAMLLKATNRLAEAEPLMRRVVSICEMSLGKNHPNVATALNNLARLLIATNRLAEAEAPYRRALAIDEQNLGENHPDVATDLNNLAGLLCSTNRLAEAEPLSRRMVEMLLQFTRATGHPHPHLQDAVDNYAGLLHAMGRSPAEIRDTLVKLGQRFGVDLVGMVR